MEYTIKQQGGRWVASDGVHAVESDDPTDAMFQLSLGKLNQKDGFGSVEDTASELKASDAEDSAVRTAANLVRFMAIRVPAPVLRETLQTLTRQCERLIALGELDKS